MPQSHFRKNRLSKGLLHGQTSFRSDILTRKHGEDSYYTFVERNQTFFGLSLVIQES